MRLMAMPYGSWLQFRYDQRWVAKSILSSLEDEDAIRQIDGSLALIAYIDQSEKGQTPVIVPCRAARLREPVLLGGTVSVQLELREYAYAADLAAFHEDIESVAGEELPRWVGGAVEGAYWSQVSHHPRSIRRSITVDTWEQIVGQLAARKDFADERFFYLLESIFDEEKGVSKVPKRNSLRLIPNREYEIRLYHLHPTEGDPGSELSIDTSHEAISFTSSPSMLLDSRYDVKRVRFHTGVPTTRQRGILTFRTRPGGQDSWRWEFDVPAQIRGVFWRKVGAASLIGLFLAVPVIYAALRDGDLSSDTKWIISGVALLMSFLAGLTAAFGLRRTL